MTEVAPAVSNENRFEPRLEGVPLLLTLDARSLSGLAGEDRERAEFLCELCLAPAVDGLWTWGSEPLVEGLPQTELRSLDTARDDRPVGLLGDPHGFLGGVGAWSSHERLADSTYALKGGAREWFIHYSTATAFHRNAKRHFFVTADPRILSELRGGRRQSYWQRGRVIAVPGALRLAGQVMRAREQICERAAENYRQHVSPYTVYFYLGPELAPGRIRLHRWLEERTLDSAPELGALEQAIHDRVVDLLKARDHIALQSGRHQNNATLDEILYHLRAAVGSAAALFDSIAVFAQCARKIDEKAVGGAVGLSLRNPKFRRALRKRDASRLADAAGRLAPILELTWTLRTPIVHRAGLSGTSYLDLRGHGAMETRVGLSEDQAIALDNVRAHRRETASQWGRGEFASTAHVEPQAFSNGFCLVVIEAAEGLIQALADDLEAPAHAFVREPGKQEVIRRYRWLAGLPSEGFFSVGPRPPRSVSS